MSVTELALLITAIVTPLGATIAAIWKAFQYFLAKEAAFAKMELLKEQAEATVTAKNEEIKDWETRCGEWEKRFDDLWSMLESLTT